jgi:3-oxocholest-4-en-26-oate---CoA ligase
VSVGEPMKTAGRTFALADVFEVVVDACPDRVALVAGEDALTYRQLDERANRLGHYLASAGVGPGDFVGILSRNRVEWVESMVGAYKIRASPSTSAVAT